MHPSIQDVASSSEAFATQGFIAIAPNGVLYSGSSSLTGLIEDLRMKLPDMAEDYDCPRRLNIDPPCRSNIDPGLVAAF